MQCARHVSGNTLISYFQNRKIGKSNNTMTLMLSYQTQYGVNLLSFSFNLF
jgi:hypothetical protein